VWGKVKIPAQKLKQGEEFTYEGRRRNHNYKRISICKAEMDVRANSLRMTRQAEREREREREREQTF